MTDTYTPTAKDKFVRLRNGIKAEIYRIHKEGIYPIHGTTNLGVCMAWTRSGRYDIYDDQDHNRDIVSPWTEPFRIEGKIEWCTDEKNGPVYPEKQAQSELDFDWIDLVGKRGTLVFTEDVE